MVSRIRTALNAAIRNATAHYNRGREFSRKRTLTRETVIRLLISAEGGSLAKILHDAGIQATASALSQRRAQIPPEVFRTVFTNFNSTCADNEFFCGYRRECCRKWGYLRRQRHCHRVRPGTSVSPAQRRWTNTSSRGCTPQPWRRSSFLPMCRPQWAIHRRGIA